MIRRASWAKRAVLAILGVWLGAVACSDDEGGITPSPDSGTGGSAGSGGTAGSPEAATDAPSEDSGCESPQGLYYAQPGCDGSVAPLCAGPQFDACLIYVCGCDGTTLSGCGFYPEPFQHYGDCSEGGVPDASADGGG